MAGRAPAVPATVTTVDVIIPTHDGHDMLRACLGSLRRSAFTDFSVVVVDDASRTPVHDLVQEVYPEATVIRLERNAGLARACNLAMQQGTSEFVALLNDDTEVEPDWLGELVQCARRHPQAGSVASKMLLMSDRRRIHSAGDYYSTRGMPGNRGVWLEDLGQFDREEPVFAACGGAALYRRSALDKVRFANGQYLDDRLFMYCEDVDLAWRLHTAGWSCVYTPRAVVYHHLSATAGGTLASYLVSRNVWLLLSRSIPPGVMTPFKRSILAFHAGRVASMLRHIREPAARASLRGTIAGLALALRDRRTHRPQLPADEILRLRNLLHRHTPPFAGA